MTVTHKTLSILKSTHKFTLLETLQRSQRIAYVTVEQICHAIKHVCVCVLLFICISAYVRLCIFLLYHVIWYECHGKDTGQALFNPCVCGLWAGCHATLPPTERGTSKKVWKLIPQVEPLNRLPVKINSSYRGMS